MVGVIVILLYLCGVSWRFVGCLVVGFRLMFCILVLWVSGVAVWDCFCELG